MIATAPVTITATDWVRLGEKRIAILAGPVEQVENNIAAPTLSTQGKHAERKRQGCEKSFETQSQQLVAK